MKNYSNIYKTLLFLIVILATACSSDDSESEPNNTENTEFKFLSTITDDEWQPGDLKYRGKDTLVYENGKIIKSYHNAGCDSHSSQYEYGSNQKVSIVYSRNYNPNDYEELINMFESNSIKENYTKRQVLTYDNANRLKNIVVEPGGSMGYPSYSYQYDDKDRLYKISSSDGYSSTVMEFDDKGNALSIKRMSSSGGSSSINNYIYGHLKNPSYDLFKKYGIDPSECTLSEGMLSPNVILSSSDWRGTRTYIYSSTDDKYPATMLFRGNYDHNYSFTYQQN